MGAGKTELWKWDRADLGREELLRVSESFLPFFLKYTHKIGLPKQLIARPNPLFYNFSRPEEGIPISYSPVQSVSFSNSAL